METSRTRTQHIFIVMVGNISTMTEIVRVRQSKLNWIRYVGFTVCAGTDIDRITCEQK